MRIDPADLSENKSEQWLISYDPDRPGQSRVDFREGRIRQLPGLVLWGDNEELSVAISAQTQVTSIFIGILYDNAALRAALAIPEGAPLEQADLTLQAYLTWGEAACDRIKGIYSWFIWDGKSNQLICVRDRIGIHPIYFTRVGSSYLLSDSIENLIRLPDVSAQINRAALADHLCNHWPRMQETFYEHIRRVPPGNLMKISAGQEAIYRYWYVIQDEDQVNWLADEEIGQFDRIFEQATSRIMDLGKSAIFLSGGLDSVSVAAVAADLAVHSNRQPPLALSLIFPFPEINEKEIQQSVARQLGMPQVLVDIYADGTDSQLLEAAIQANSLLNTIPLHLWLPGYQRLTQEAVNAGCRVILTGSGGDEWLNVSPTYAADLIRRARFSDLRRLLNQYINSFNAPSWRLYYYGIWKFGLRPLLGQLTGDVLLATSPDLIRKRRRNSYLRHQPAWIAPDSRLNQELVRRIDESVEKSIQDQHIKSIYIKEMHTSLEHPLVAMELETSYELTRNYKIKKLAPFQDADLVDFLYRTPPKYLIRGGMAKGMVRESLAKRFPDLGFDTQKKKAATGFFRHVLINQGKISWAASKHAEALTDLGIIDPVKLDNELQDIFSGRSSPARAWLIWNILSLESWTKRRLI